jgi:large subunit ribosomal protein L16
VDPHLSGLPVSSKPAEVRMGSGKGSPEYWVAAVKPGRILFELDGVPGPLAKTAFERAAEKLPIRSRWSPALAKPWLRRLNHGEA